MSHGQLSNNPVEDTEIILNPDESGEAKNVEAQEDKDPVADHNKDQGKDWISGIK